MQSRCMSAELEIMTAWHFELVKYLKDFIPHFRHFARRYRRLVQIWGRKCAVEKTSESTIKELIPILISIKMR
jgi:sulfur relay (sulfurtransferase) DsrC/TusE family protein